MRRLVTSTIALLASILPVSAVEQPRYAVQKTRGNVELRSYEPMVVAEVRVDGARDAAVQEGFRILADYIFGSNEPKQKIAMTAPVTQQAGEKIAMTAPVTQQGKDGQWTVRFIMPAGQSLETLPKPKNPRIQLTAVPARNVAAIRFSGFWSDSAMQVHRDELAAAIKDMGLEPVGTATFAYYDPPWTLPFMRRNEVLWEVR
jgi:hypothetical protein